MEKIKLLLTQYQEAILYIVFGGLTMLVNIIAFWLAFQAWHMNSSVSYLFAWFWSIFLLILQTELGCFTQQLTTLRR